MNGKSQISFIQQGARKKKILEKLLVFKESSKQLVGPMLALKTPLIFVAI